MGRLGLRLRMLALAAVPIGAGVSLVSIPSPVAASANRANVSHIAAALTSGPQVTTTDNAVAYQIDATHAGGQPSDSLQASGPGLIKKWTVDLGGWVSYPLIADGMVFVTVAESATNSTKLMALNQSTGATVWGPIELGGPYPWSNATYEAGRVFVVNNSALLRAYDAATGAILWTTQLPQQYTSTPPTAAFGLVFTGVYAIRQADGTIEWPVAVSGPGDDGSSPAVTADGVYVSYFCSHAYDFSVGSGALIWQHNGSCFTAGGMTPVVYGRRVYARDIFTQNLILDATTGNSLGTFSATPPPAFAGSRGFFVSGGKLQAQDLGSGTNLWNFGDGITVNIVTAPLLANGTVYVGSSNGTVFGLDPVGGATLWQGSAGSAIDGPGGSVGRPLTGMAAGLGWLDVPESTGLTAFTSSLNVSPGNLVFGGQPTGTSSAPVPVQVTNYGAAPITISGVSTLGDFSEGDNCVGTLATGASCTINVTFGPTTSGQRNGALTLTDNASGSPQTFALTGNDLVHSPPGAPGNVTAQAGASSATVTWSPPTSGGVSPILSYTVTSNPGNVTVTTKGTKTSAVISPLTPGVSYTFTVTATNYIDTGPTSAPSNAVLAFTFAGSPTNATAIPGDSVAFLSWTAPASDGYSAITGYQVTPFIGATAQPPTSIAGSSTSAIVAGLTNGTTYTFTVSAVNAAGPGPPSAPSNAVTPIQGGNYHPLSPTRILDTRDGTGAVAVPVGPNSSLTVQITGRGGVPSNGVSAVVLNVTVTNTSAASYLTVYPSGVSRPLASNLNWVTGETVPNLVEVAVGTRGAVTVYNAAGRTDVIFDVAGWVGVASNSLTKDGLYNPVVPNRVLDTRSGTGGVPKAPVGPGQMISIQVAGTPNIPTTGVAAVILNVTVTGPTAPSYLTVFPTGTQPPLASNLNFVAGQTVPNRVIVKLGTNPATGTPGWVSLFNAAGSVNVIADVGGWFTDASSTAGGTRFTGTIPSRIFDSRQPGIGRIGPGQTASLTLYDQNGMPVTGVSAVVINVTVTNATAPSYLTLWPYGTPQPLASDLNFVAGQTVPNLVVVKLSAPTRLDGPATFNVYNAAGWADVIIDLVGFYGTPQPAPSGPAAMVLRLSPHRVTAASRPPS